ncbi:class I SAM-dependent methyltransferase [Actinomadura luteofluorescens]|uniref:class I SAM-dependent methyltransferase n=1 Tax=Actinomadura luteofluorescens TaxID=46163 RepID=UPI002164240C|nr:class I SAM-dependent methyltransferase [Actinomadura glauciflava]MCR3741635.1 Methyltransferase domain-containing protein [Actinomadura glauciflava]
MNWKTAPLLATLYDFAVQNRALSRLGARVLWNYDITHLHELIAAQDPAALTLDIPCGGGLAIRDNPRHVAADLSGTMLKRARRKTTTLVQADIYNLPFPTDTFDACLTYNGLHCLKDPQRALRELTRVLRPGGTLQGTTLVRAAGRDPLINLFRRQGAFGNPGTRTDLRTWLETAPLTNITLTASSAVTAFTARKSGTHHSPASAKVV